jgi:hypothetical protein
MWIFMHGAFLSIVTDANNTDKLLVRARHAGDIEDVFSAAKVMVTPTTDYRYRASVQRAIAAKAIADQVGAIDYMNFIDSVTDKSRRSVYLDVWRSMFMWQEGHSAGPPRR